MVTEKQIDITETVSYDYISDRVAESCGACSLGRNLRGSPHFTIQKSGSVSGKIF